MAIQKKKKNSSLQLNMVVLQSYCILLAFKNQCFCMLMFCLFVCDCSVRLFLSFFECLTNCIISATLHSHSAVNYKWTFFN